MFLGSRKRQLDQKDLKKRNMAKTFNKFTLKKVTS